MADGSQHAAPDQENRELVQRFMAANGQGDWEAVGQFLGDSMVMEWPQSGERFVGRANAVGAMSVQEDKPEMAGEPRIVGSGGTWVVMVPLRYGPDLFHYVAVLEIADGKIEHGTGYWGAPFPPQESRAAFAAKR